MSVQSRLSPSLVCGCLFPLLLRRQAFQSLMLPPQAPARHRTRNHNEPPPADLARLDGANYFDIIRCRSITGRDKCGVKISSA
ncbi:hypothetical protein CEXT_225251 [Caerostris extrusa]|uniref:Secreted protein n=1 Tax=Caerostris extrusa TaxID=172846 RepID=A0AAV4NAH6_CAEEX|nr:hypothetical protein CEXT_225251 [Caerostris extrusa]